MNARPLVPICLLFALAGGVFGWVRARAPRGPAAISSAEPDKHKVTPVMAREAEERERRPAPTFRREAADGSACDLDRMRDAGPVVLLFIKDGCPCSVSAEAYFNQMHASYRGRVQFLGVIDGDSAVARRWGSANGVPFPIIADPSLGIARAFGATNSAYVALVARDGTLDGFWPGYSSAMLRDLNARVARLSGLPQEPLDTPDAPEDLYSGCPFDFPTSAPNPGKS